MLVFLAFVDVPDGFGAWHDWPFNLSGEKHFCSPHDWRGMTATGNGSLPTNVFRIVPLGGETGLGRNSSAASSPPLRPIRLSVDWRIGGSNNQQQQNRTKVVMVFDLHGPI